MDFLKRHYEKIVLAVALLTLIGAAAYLVMKVSDLEKTVGAPPIPQPPRNTGVKPLNTDPYEKALASLERPPLWTRSATNLFGVTPVVQDTGIFSGPITKIDNSATTGNGALQVRIDQGVMNVDLGPRWEQQKGQFGLKEGDSVQIRGSYSGAGAERRIVAQELIAHGKTFNREPPRSDPDLVLLKVNRQDFELLFRAYAWDEVTKQARSFQLNTRSRTFFIGKVGDEITLAKDKVYKLIKFEKLQETVEVAGIGPQVRDASRVTISLPGQEPIVLPVNKRVQPNPTAEIKCRAKDEPLTVKVGDSFACARVAYKVVDISPTQVILTTPDNKQVVLVLPATQ